MKGSIFFATLIACAGLLPATSRAADGVLCFSSMLTHTQTVDGTGNYSTTFPQISNTTKYTCRTTTAYTLSQFMQQGWIVDSMVPIVYSSAQSVNTTTGTGTATTKTRWQVVLRKP